MFCPSCHQPALALELNGVEIDRCPTCEGVWLDREEVAWLSDPSSESGAPLTAALAKGPDGPKSDRRCPRCRRLMRIEELAPIVLDRCPLGHGIWFDSGEVDSFLNTAQQGESAAAANAIADILGRKPPRQ